ncbi:hypothetical protein C3K47_03235 [Solitalea longa]|uniref:Uncharacterized protein n=1 Tax=Solitalea longa TaxID=2079460 RepID=A0A2S5A847_9SPHI|nr:antitoxin Xre/MbcA/ParS toxin-binding domain-containing protein [Solitalea longa]POY38427.1 hypothetical protein C3K47_03235 [Solitalea longa]
MSFEAHDKGVPYGKVELSESTELVQLMGGLTALKITNQPRSEFDWMNIARNGIPKKAVMELAKKISFSLAEIATVLHLSERSLHRYTSSSILKTEYAEKTVELAKLYTRGEEVFGNMDTFKNWMRTPSFILGGEAPINLLDNSLGFNIVLNELGKIEHGVLA